MIPAIGTADCAYLERVEGFMDDYKKVLEQSDGPYNLYTMRFVDQPMLDLSWYIRGLLFNESQMHVSYTKT